MTMLTMRYISLPFFPCKKMTLFFKTKLIPLLIMFCIYHAGIVDTGMVYASTSNEYIVGEGDVIDINVYENEDLSTTVRISSGNTIRVHLLGEIDVKDLTVSQVSEKIEKLFANGYLVNPQVDVFINKYRSKRAIILGEVKKPGQYELQGKITMLEFISMAEGLTPDAGGTITIKRINIIDKTDDKIVLDLEKLVEHGDTTLNIEIENNDSIYIAKADTFYVSGEVEKPDSYKLEPDLTVIMAITKAGGFSDIASKKKVKINRILKNGDKTILKNVDMDEPVMPDDVIIVPESFF